MSFLFWNNQKDANDSLFDINSEYGCPYLEENGYKMDEWDIVTKSNAINQWGFFKPETRLGKDSSIFVSKFKPGHTEIENRPNDWYPDDVF